MTHDIMTSLLSISAEQEVNNETEQSILSLLERGEVFESSKLANNYLKKLLKVGNCSQGLLFLKKFSGFALKEKTKWFLFFFARMGEAESLWKLWSRLEEHSKKNYCSELFKLLLSVSDLKNSQQFLQFSVDFKEEIFFNPNKKRSKREVVKFLIDYVVLIENPQEDFILELVAFYKLKQVSMALDGKFHKGKEKAPQENESPLKIVEKIRFFKSLKKSERVKELEVILKAIDPDHQYFHSKENFTSALSTKISFSLNEKNEPKKNQQLSAFIKSQPEEEIVKRFDDYMILLGFLEEVQIMHYLFDKLWENSDLNSLKKVELAGLYLEALIKAEKYHDGIDIFWKVYENEPLSSSVEIIFLDKYLTCLHGLGRNQKALEVERKIKTLNSKYKKSVLRLRKSETS